MGGLGGICLELFAIYHKYTASCLFPHVLCFTLCSEYGTLEEDGSTSPYGTDPFRGFGGPSRDTSHMMSLSAAQAVHDELSDPIDGAHDGGAEEADVLAAQEVRVVGFE